MCGNMITERVHQTPTSAQLDEHGLPVGPRFYMKHDTVIRAIFTWRKGRASESGCSAKKFYQDYNEKVELRKTGSWRKF